MSDGHKHISLNGDLLQTPTATLAELLQAQGFDVSSAMACAVNARFVPRTQWPVCALAEGDRVDVIAPVTGG